MGESFEARVTRAPKIAAMPGVEETSKRTEAMSDHQPRKPLAVLVAPQSLPDLLTAILAIVDIGAHLALRYGFSVSTLSQNIPLYVTLFLGGLPLFFHLSA